MTKNFQESGVAEIVGSLMLIAIIALGISIAALFLLNTSIPEKIPEFRASLSNTSTRLTLHHDGGDSIPMSSFSILVNGNPTDFVSSGAPSPDWSIGDTLTFSSYDPTTPLPDVKIIYNGSAGERVLADFSTIIPQIVPTHTGTSTTAQTTFPTSTQTPPVGHTITASTGNGGSISPSGAVIANNGDTPTFTFTPAPGYHLDTVTVDGNMVSPTGNNYTFPPVYTDHSIIGFFTVNQYTITPSVSGGKGEVIPVTVQTVNYGDTPLFTFVPAKGYYLDSVTVDESPVITSGNTYTFPPVTANHKIDGSFAITGSHSNDILLNSASNGGYLKDGTSFSLWTNGGGQKTNYISFDKNPPFYIGPNDYVEVIVKGDQTSGQIYMTDSVTTCDIDAIAFVNDKPVGGGHITGIYIQKFKEYKSTLSYVYQGKGSMQFVVDKKILIDWGDSGYHNIIISNIDETSNVLNMNWGPGKAYVVCSGDYTMFS